MGSTHGYAGLFVSARHFSTLPRSDRSLSERGDKPGVRGPLSYADFLHRKRHKMSTQLRNPYARNGA